MNRKTRVLHVLKSSVYSGAENIAIMIIKGLENQYESAYLATDGEISHVLEREHIKGFLLGKYTRKNIQKVIRKYRPDIVHAHDFTATVMCALISGKFRLISHLHYDPPWVKNWNVKTIIYSLCFLKIRKVLSVSNIMMEQMIFADKFKAKSLVVKNPINVSRVIERAQEGLADADYKSDLLFVGRLVEQKDPGAFITMVSKVKAKGHPDIFARMVGDGVLLDYCRDLVIAQDLENNIELLGFQENPYRYMKHTRVLCMTSRWEGFGLVLAEAAALGIPVLSTRTSGACDVLGSGSWALCDDEEVMVEKVEKLLFSPEIYEREHFEALARIKGINDLDAYLSKVAAIYQTEVE